MTEIASEPNDFVRLISQLTNFVENERIRAYNEGIDMMLNQTRTWMRQNDLQPRGDNLPDLLTEIDAQVAARHRTASGF